jgi:hypothetical protein
MKMVFSAIEPEQDLITPSNGVHAQPEKVCHISRMQTLYLRRLHGLTEAQANALAALIWGASQ